MTSVAPRREGYGGTPAYWAAMTEQTPPGRTADEPVWTPATDRARPAGRWVPRTTAQLQAARVAATRALEQAREAARQASELRTQTREASVDARRRLASLQAECAELQRRSAEHLARGQEVVATMRPRAVVAHRATWFSDRLAGCLEQRGVRVVERVADGCQATAVAVLEQPDLLVVEDLLPGRSGLELVQQAPVLYPRTVVAAQAASNESLAQLAALGAGAVFHRRVPPRDVAEELLASLLQA